mgnify:CR=1 FL=1
MDNRGFIIQDMIEFFRVTVFDLKPSIPLETQSHCPACETFLETLAVLVGNSGRQQMRLGFCTTCGYVGYIDRPKKEWMVDFYSTAWDAHIAKSVQEVRNQPSLKDDKKSSRRLAVNLAESLHIPHVRPVCEIGTGYGSVLKYFKDAGYSHVYGTENSKHRAQAVSEAYGLSVFTGNFEGEDVQKELRRVAPIGLFFSHHVFEHVYHPAEVIRAIAALQQEGDYIILALPGADEHAAYGLFYLPHLHVFTKESLELLLNRFGYAGAGDASPGGDNMILAFRKVASPQKQFPLKTDYRAEILRKYRQGLGLEAMGDGKLFEYRWLVPHQGFDDAEMIPVSRISWTFKKIVAFLKSKLKRFTSTHRFLVRPLEKRVTDAPIEIHYPDNIKLLMK